MPEKTQYQNEKGTASAKDVCSKLWAKIYRSAKSENITILNAHETKHLSEWGKEVTFLALVVGQLDGERALNRASIEETIYWINAYIEQPHDTRNVQVSDDKSNIGYGFFDERTDRWYTTLGLSSEVEIVHWAESPKGPSAIPPLNSFTHSKN